MAMIMALDDENKSSYWLEKNFHKSDPPISKIINKKTGPGSTLSDFVSISPENILGPDTNFYYDNDGDNSTTCTKNNIDKGVNIFLKNLSLKDRQEIDKIIDGKIDGNCGKVRYKTNGTANLYYKISDIQSF